MSREKPTKTPNDADVIVRDPTSGRALITRRQSVESAAAAAATTATAPAALVYYDIELRDVNWHLQMGIKTRQSVSRTGAKRKHTKAGDFYNTRRWISVRANERKGGGATVASRNAHLASVVLNADMLGAYSLVMPSMLPCAPRMVYETIEGPRGQVVEKEFPVQDAANIGDYLRYFGLTDMDMSLTALGDGAAGGDIVPGVITADMCRGQKSGHVKHLWIDFVTAHADRPNAFFMDASPPWAAVCRETFTLVSFLHAQRLNPLVYFTGGRGFRVFWSDPRLYFLVNDRHPYSDDFLERVGPAYFASLGAAPSMFRGLDRNIYQKSKGVKPDVEAHPSTGLCPVAFSSTSWAAWLSTRIVQREVDPVLSTQIGFFWNSVLRNVPARVTRLAEGATSSVQRVATKRKAGVAGAAAGTGGGGACGEVDTLSSSSDAVQKRARPTSDDAAAAAAAADTSGGKARTLEEEIDLIRADMRANPNLIDDQLVDVCVESILTFFRHATRIPNLIATRLLEPRISTHTDPVTRVVRTTRGFAMILSDVIACPYAKREHSSADKVYVYCNLELLDFYLKCHSATCFEACNLALKSRTIERHKIFYGARLDQFKAERRQQQQQRAPMRPGAFPLHLPPLPPRAPSRGASGGAAATPSPSVPTPSPATLSSSLSSSLHVQAPTSTTVGGDAGGSGGGGGNLIWDMLQAAAMPTTSPTPMPNAVPMEDILEPTIVLSSTDACAAAAAPSPPSPSPSPPRPQPRQPRVVSDAERRYRQSVFAGRSSLLSGAPGTGKTYLEDVVLYEYARRQPRRVILRLASDGTAAGASNAHVLHGWAGMCTETFQHAHEVDAFFRRCFLDLHAWLTRSQGKCSTEYARAHALGSVARCARRESKYAQAGQRGESVGTFVYAPATQRKVVATPPGVAAAAASASASILPPARVLEPIRFPTPPDEYFALVARATDLKTMHTAWSTEIKRWFVQDSMQPLLLRLALVDVIACDEFTKLGPCIFLMLHKLACRARGQHARPMGGIQWLPVGDKNQIGHITDRDAQPQFRSILDTPLWHHMFGHPDALDDDTTTTTPPPPPRSNVCVLTQARRQAHDTYLFEMGKRFAARRITEADIRYCKVDLARPLPDDVERVWSYVHHVKVQERNEVQLRALAAATRKPLHTYAHEVRDAVTGAAIQLTPQLMKELGLRETCVRLCEGCPVRYQANVDPSRMLYTNAQGRVCGFFNPHNVGPVAYPIIQFEREVRRPRESRAGDGAGGDSADDNNAPLEFDAWIETFTYFQKPTTSTRYAASLARRVQLTTLGVVPCFAVTMDSTQGKTLTGNITRLNATIFHPGQAVVTLTRVTSSRHLQIEEFDESWVRAKFMQAAPK
jgi:hypothetical protein